MILIGWKKKIEKEKYTIIFTITTSIRMAWLSNFCRSCGQVDSLNSAKDLFFCAARRNCCKCFVDSVGFIFIRYVRFVQFKRVKFMITLKQRKLKSWWLIFFFQSSLVVLSLFFSLFISSDLNEKKNWLQSVG